MRVRRCAESPRPGSHAQPHLLCLPQDDVALTLDRRLVEQRVNEHVREDGDGKGDVVLKHFRVKDRVLPRRVRVQVATNVLDCLFELRLRVPGRPLER